MDRTNCGDLGLDGTERGGVYGQRGYETTAQGLNSVATVLDPGEYHIAIVPGYMHRMFR
jgi:hypothetical protein